MRIVFVLLTVWIGLTSYVMTITDDADTDLPRLVDVEGEAFAVYANVRGYRQAAGEVAIYFREKSPHFGFC